MRIAFLDSTAVVAEGPGSPAYFSRFLIKHLRAEGHQVVISMGFDEELCRVADLVVCEWANQDAFEAAASGVCKRLVVRVRGFDAHGPLDKLDWANVDLLVYESWMLREFTVGRFPMIGAWAPRSMVLASGIDVAGAPFLRRTWPTRPVVALVARATNDKGYQLAFEWARQSRVQLHVTLALPETSPRLVEYLRATKPNNVEIHGTVDTMPWLNEIHATHVLSASIWETLGYTMVEGMAVGCKPLIHRAPGAGSNWPPEFLWTTFRHLDSVLDDSFDSDIYRTYALDHFDERTLSRELIEMMMALPPVDRTEVALRRVYARREKIVEAVHAVAASLDPPIEPVVDMVERFRRETPAHDSNVEERYGCACGLAGAFLARGDLEEAAVWACRAVLDGPWPDAFCLLGEIAAARGDIDEARDWYAAAVVLPDPPRRVRVSRLVDARKERHAELHALNLSGKPTPWNGKFAVVVTVRNAAPWIEACLASIAMQEAPFKCLVIDDASTDDTVGIACAFATADPRFVVVVNAERKWQARNMVEGARLVTDNPEDVVVFVDGDDSLLPDAFLRIRQEYMTGAWMTYGNFVTSEGKRSHIGPYPARIARSGDFAKWTWQATAIRTFKRFLLDYLKDEDFTLAGEWPKVAGDVCVLVPMLEMACERARPILDPIYVYNTTTADNDHKRDAYEQIRVRDLLMGRSKKARLP